MTTPALTPVVVSRIQNRRGTQAQFNALYPTGYQGIGGFGSITGFDITTYPDVLMPGEIALCTDSRRIFIGNVNGEYIEISNLFANNELVLTPVDIVLPPVSVPTIIPQLTYAASPYLSILYSLTDSSSTDWNTVGTNFSRSGRLDITAVANFAPTTVTPPQVPVTPVTLMDTGTEINLQYPNVVNFIAEYDTLGTSIEIYYSHNFSSSLTFSTSTMRWIAF